MFGARHTAAPQHALPPGSHSSHRPRRPTVPTEWPPTGPQHPERISRRCRSRRKPGSAIQVPSEFVACRGTTTDRRRPTPLRHANNPSTYDAVNNDPAHPANIAASSSHAEHPTCAPSQAQPTRLPSQSPRTPVAPLRLPDYRMDPTCWGAIEIRTHSRPQLHYSNSGHFVQE